MDSLKNILSGFSIDKPTPEEPDFNWEAFFSSHNYDEGAIEVLVRFAPRLKELRVNLGDPDLIEVVEGHLSVLEESLVKLCNCPKTLESPTAYFKAILKNSYQECQPPQLPVYAATDFDTPIDLHPPKSIEQLQADLGRGRLQASLVKIMLRSNPQWGLEIVNGQIVEVAKPVVVQEEKEVA